VGSEGKRPLYIIRRDADGPMWLSREQPAVTWGGRDRALRYGSKGEAARAVERLRLGAVTIERMTEDERG
jgi:hypothetical protein